MSLQPARNYDRITVVDFPNGASAIDGWIDGKTHAVISWRGYPSTENEGSDVYRRVVVDQRVAMNMLSDIERYQNLKLISARIETEK